jgi:fructose-specific phosphotransferase system component IIB
VTLLVTVTRKHLDMIDRHTTYMAAEGLEQAAKAAGHEIEVETQGAAGLTPLSPETIAAADAVIHDQRADPQELFDLTWRI